MGYLVLFPKARCEEDVDLFRDIMYMLLGLLMNLCLQSPFVSEVQYSFLPTWNLGQPDHNLWHRTFSFSQIGRSPWTPALAVGMGRAGWMLCHFPEGQMSHLVRYSFRKLSAECAGHAKHGAGSYIYKVK